MMGKNPILGQSKKTGQKPSQQQRLKGQRKNQGITPNNHRTTTANTPESRKSGINK